LYAVLLAAVASGCTWFHTTEKFQYARAADTLMVRLAPSQQARWDATHDSLVVLCANCEADSRVMIEHFDDNNSVVYSIDPQADLKLQLTYLGEVQTVDLPGVADSSAPNHAVHRVPHKPRHAATATKEPIASPKKPVEKPVVEKPAPEKPAVHTARSVRVTAPEGVAIYKDKSKTEVLKILPAGTNISLLAREGDLLSVTVDGQEGFVEAEAVQVNE
jgi:hypothetical protein